jgi:hypothetical protein
LRSTRSPSSQLRREAHATFATDTRLTNGFSKKVENLKAAVALHFAHYNFVRLHKTLRITPAMAAGVSDRLWALEELVEQTSK